jgi:excisionase family DNA binding protein
LVTLAEAAELMHVSVRHLRRLIAKGELEPTRVGGTVRLSPEALAALIDKSD